MTSLLFVEASVLHDLVNFGDCFKVVSLEKTRFDEHKDADIFRSYATGEYTM